MPVKCCLSLVVYLTLACFELSVFMQTIFFIRHGEGYHNIGVLNEDAHLTDMGWRQAEALRQHMGNMRPPPDIQVA